MVSPHASKNPSLSPISRSPLACTLDSLRGSLGRYRATFDGARVRRGELGPFASPEAVDVALDASSALSSDARYALIAAIAREHASHPAGPALWSSLLLVAFRPLLLRVRTQVGRPDDTEADARVVAAFLDALALPGAAQIDLYAAVALQRATLKNLVRARKSDRKAAADAPFDEEAHTRCEPHAITLGDACADLAWADARERKLAAIPRWKTSRPRRVSNDAPSFASASLLPPFNHHHATPSTGVSP